MVFQNVLFMFIIKLYLITFRVSIVIKLVIFSVYVFDHVYRMSIVFNGTYIECNIVRICRDNVGVVVIIWKQKLSLQFYTTVFPLASRSLRDKGATVFYFSTYSVVYKISPIISILSMFYHCIKFTHEGYIKWRK